MYQTERTMVDTATNENFSSRNSASSLENKCSMNKPPPALQFLDPTAVHDDEDCVRQTADPNGACETQDDLGAPARNHLQPHNFLPATLHEWPP